jgi:hypothetical protein
MYRLVVMFYNISYNLSVGLLTLTLLRNFTVSFGALGWKFSVRSVSWCGVLPPTGKGWWQEVSIGDASCLPCLSMGMSTSSGCEWLWLVRVQCCMAYSIRDLLSVSLLTLTLLRNFTVSSKVRGKLSCRAHVVPVDWSACGVCVTY